MLETSSVTKDWQVMVDDPITSNHASVLGLPMFGSDDLAIEEAASALADLVTSEQLRPT